MGWGLKPPTSFMLINKFIFFLKESSHDLHFTNCVFFLLSNQRGALGEDPDADHVNIRNAQIRSLELLKSLLVG